MLFRRKIYDKLLEWKRRSHGETALLIEGARRVGKSTVVEEFGRREYKSVVVIDFMKPNRKVVSAILEHPDDLNILFTEISLAYNKTGVHTTYFDWDGRIGDKATQGNLGVYQPIAVKQAE